MAPTHLERVRNICEAWGRIELGEIEAVLGAHPGVRETVVLAREDRPGEKRLVAYVVPQAGASVAAEDLRGFLTARLPAYMLPAVFLSLESVPVTPSGKIDRQALLELELPDREPRLSSTPPQTDVERSIAVIWEEILHLRIIGVHENFFELGGHSLSVMRIHRPAIPMTAISD